MRQRINATLLALAISTLALAGCSDNSSEFSSEDSAASEVSSESIDAAIAIPEPAQSIIPNLGDLPVGLPKLAYVFDYAFRLPADEITILQRRHADLCEQQGPLKCRIISMNQSGGDGDYVSGHLQLAVASSGARAFGTKLEGEAATLGAEQTSAAIQAEELSKQMVDTEAHLTSRRELRDRLMDVLRTRKGNVGDLVEAERSVAAVNEEIDRAESWLAEMRQRVAFSRMNISYESGSPASGAFAGPIREAFGSMAGILGTMVALLLILGTITIPLTLLAFAARWVQRRSRPVFLAATASDG